ncbi:hypothetical protein [Parabacteroides faecis]|uniref:hypothetical protein n=1 Tax=Parabacteroides faecis TaxID=1217282 RepID=UPI002166B508|nr:hypothetical protein [Parabacteroides faecis]MCS2892293.1 hypothetical protein [Parabacteroides faecis]
MDEEGDAVDALFVEVGLQPADIGSGGHTLRQAGGKAQAGLRADRGFTAGDVFFRTGCQGQQQGKEGE